MVLGQGGEGNLEMRKGIWMPSGRETQKGTNLVPRDVGGYCVGGVVMRVGRG